MESGSSAAPGCGSVTLDVARLERGNLVLHLGNVALLRCPVLGESSITELLLGKRRWVVGHERCP